MWIEYQKQNAIVIAFLVMLTFGTHIAQVAAMCTRACAVDPLASLDSVCTGNPCRYSDGAISKGPALSSTQSEEHIESCTA